MRNCRDCGEILNHKTRASDTLCKDCFLPAPIVAIIRAKEKAEAKATLRAMNRPIVQVSIPTELLNGGEMFV